MVETDYLYVAMLKGLMSDQSYAITVANVFEEGYFETAGMTQVFKSVKSHLEEFNSLPDRDIILNSIPQDIKLDVEALMRDAEATDFDVSKNYDWLRAETNKYLKDRAIKQGIIESVDIIDKGVEGNNYDDIKRVIENALCKDINIDLGLDYFGQMSERIKRIFSATDNRVKTYYPTLDELFNGGYPPYTLNMMIAKVHGHKCVCADTMVGIRDDVNGDVFQIKIGDLYKHFYGHEHKGEIQNMKKSLKGVSKLTLMQNKYGEEEGQRRYDDYITKQKKSGTIGGYIEKYGNVDGVIKWNQRCDDIRHRGTLRGYIEKYGEEEGQRRYDDRQSLWQDTMKSKPPEEVERIIRE